MRLHPLIGDVMRLIVQLETNAVKVALRAAGRDDVLNCAVVRTVADTRHSAIQFARNDAPKRKIAEHSRICRNKSEEHTSELQSLMRNSSAVFCMKTKKKKMQKRLKHTP